MNAVRDYWVGITNHGLPSRDDPVTFNIAVTATYARWYSEVYSLCKWAGMAVVGSWNAGKYLRLLQRMERNSRFLPRVVRSFLGSQIELIWQTNTRIFDDIAWTHTAYLSPEGGLQAVQEGLRDLPSHQRLVDGFQLIDRGRELLHSDAEQARPLIWAGNRLLLQHEQFVTVQPQFEQFQPWFNCLYTLFAGSNFRLGTRGIDGNWAVFVPYMVRHGQKVLRQTGALPDIANFDQRWHWIDREALPCWERVDRNAQLLPRIRALSTYADTSSAEGPAEVPGGARLV